MEAWNEWVATAVLQPRDARALGWSGRHEGREEKEDEIRRGAERMS